MSQDVKSPKEELTTIVFLNEAVQLLPNVLVIPTEKLHPWPEKLLSAEGGAEVLTTQAQLGSKC